MVRGTLIFLAILAVVAGGALVAPGFVDWNRYKPQIIAQVEDATGYKVAIDGDLDMAVLPFPRVFINGLSVTVPGEQQPLLALQTAAVNVELMPLLRKQLHFKSVELKSPNVNMAVGADGQPVWMTPALQERLNAGRKTAAPAEGRALAVSLNGVRITDGTFVFTDRRTNKPVQLSDIDMDISAESLSGPFVAGGTLRYGNAVMKVNAKSARIDAATGSAPVQAGVEFPEAAAAATFSGVAGLKDGRIDLQGETSFKAANLSQLLLALTGKDNPALAKAVDAQGMVTLAGDALAARNVKLVYAGQTLASSVEIANIRQKPMTATLALSADKPVDVKALFPAAKAEKKPVPSLLPASLALPADINGKVEIKLAGATYDAIAAQNLVIAAQKADGKLSWTAAVEAFGGKMTEQGSLTYAAASRTPAGGVTYSEPKGQMKSTLQGVDIEDALKPFATAEQLKALGPILSDRLTGTFEGTITPQAITAAPATVKIGNETLTYSGSYKLGARPLLTLALGADSFDAGRWLQAPQQAGQAAVAAAPAAGKAKIADMAKKFALPVDLHLTLALKNVAMHGAKYDDVFFVGKVTGDRLDIEKAGLQDSAQNSVSIAGAVGSVKELRDIDLTVSGTTPDAHKMLASFNVDTKKVPQNIGRAELASEFKGQADKLGFVVNLKAMQGSLEASGTMTELLAAPKVGALDLRLRHPSYVDVVRLFNPNFSSGVAMRKSLDLFASMSRTGTLYKLTEMQAVVGDVKASGNLDIETAGVRPSVKGSVQLGVVPLDELLGVQTGGKGAVRAATGPQAAPMTGDVRWSRNAINTAWMWKADLDLTATAQSITYGEWRVDKADFVVTMKDGTLNVSRLTGDVGGGTMALTASMKSSDKERQPVAVNATAKFDNVELEQLVRGFAGSRVLRARGPVSMELETGSTGISPAALIFDLRGTGKAQGSNIVIEGFDMARLSRTLAAPSSSGTENIGNLLNATMSGGQTAFDNFYTDIAIAEGVATFPKFRLEGKDAAVTMDGNVNLPLWTVDLASDIQLTAPADAPPLRVVFKGPLDNPGQTFGKSAIEGYMQQMIGNKVQEAIQDKLGDALDGQLKQILDGSVGAPAQVRVPDAPAVPTPAPATPPVAPAPAPETPPQAVPMAPVPAEQQPVAPPAQDSPAQAPATPEDAMMNLLQGVIEGN